MNLNKFLPSTVLLLSCFACSESPQDMQLLDVPKQAPSTQTEQSDQLAVKTLSSSTGFHRKDGLIYYINWPVENANTDTFKVVKGSYNFGTDGSQAFWRKSALKGLELSNWSIIDDNYSKDTKYVFLRAQIIEDAKPASFEVLDESENLAKDDSAVFVSNMKMPLDVHSFVDLGGAGVYRDDSKAVQVSYTNSGSKVTDLMVKHPATFEHIEHRYYKDKLNVYYLGFGSLEILTGADVSSFKVISREHAEDDNAQWFKSQRQ